MEVSVRVKKRFCKDCNIPINVFHEPYFTDRLKLYDKFYGTLEKWDVFLEELQKYHCEQDYFEEYNRVKDAAILSIKGSAAYKRFNEEDMISYTIKHDNLSDKDIFKPTNDGKTFISIDMVKANFSSLHYYSEEMFKDDFGVANTWEEFISKFTNNKHIINSKYIRQVILGNCNPRRHITYEKYLMDKVLNALCDIATEERIVFFSNDEIVYDMTNININTLRLIVKSIGKTLKEKIDIPLKIELFTLHKIENTDGFYKEIIKENGENEIEFKCLDSYILPFVIRKFLGEDGQESDKVFYHDGLLAQYIEIPDIEVN